MGIDDILNTRKAAAQIVGQITLEEQGPQPDWMTKAQIADRQKQLDFSDLPTIFMLKRNNNHQLSSPEGNNNHYAATVLTELLSKRDFGEGGAFKYTLLTPEEYCTWSVALERGLLRDLHYEHMPLRPAFRHGDKGIDIITTPTTTDTEDLYCGETAHVGLEKDSHPIIETLISKGFVNPHVTAHGVGIKVGIYGGEGKFRYELPADRIDSVGALYVLPHDSPSFNCIAIREMPALEYHHTSGPILVTKRETSLLEVDAQDLTLLRAKAEAAKPLVGHLEAILAAELPPLNPAPATGTTRVGADQLKELQRQARMYEQLKRVRDEK